ncbi:MAG: methyltransferase [Lachnospiraceae bacterium]|nr:methyltransferase [Lachnospiraceae bacterium]
MDKVLVEIQVPAINEVYDAFIPVDVQLGQVTELVGRLVEKLSDGNFRFSNTTVLCNAETGNIYDINIVVEELKIKNGSRFILI